MNITLHGVTKITITKLDSLITKTWARKLFIEYKGNVIEIQMFSDDVEALVPVKE